MNWSRYFCVNLCYKADNFATAPQPGMIGKTELRLWLHGLLQPSLGAGEKRKHTFFHSGRNSGLSEFSLQFRMTWIMQLLELWRYLLHSSVGKEINWESFILREEISLQVIEVNSPWPLCYTTSEFALIQDLKKIHSYTELWDCAEMSI